MRRIVRRLGAAALTVLTTILLVPAPAQAAPAGLACGSDCWVLSKDAICWETEQCPIDLVIKGKIGKGGVAVRFWTEDLRAQAPDDYEPVKEGLLELVEGDTERSITLRLVADGVAERDETLRVWLTTGLGEPLAVTVTILDAEKR
ncbi:Calx-beta domain-containing protein [Catellatospora sp. KI3]|uniref:Calx-beta domain-containing protein n=1 Tax=Catellatospora sp. KI3 TaxID=3041620 RepID=UPI002482CE6D|nr:Calx-beta domain-containing protein [Catellatospora sp. KI3]MDI1463198.1 Calx-beta domain-containing protein [Catellatospora sp. KI3]